MKRAPQSDQPGIRARYRIGRGDFALDADLDVPGQGVTAIFGPSGCGKTTLLRAIAGLENCRDGELRVGADTWQDQKYCLAPHRRPIGYVFQEASLFPHLTVRGNLDYASKRRRDKARRIAFDDVVDLLGIGDLLTRRPANLSGGERQRVAIARALLSAPHLLLMDEPLAALDRDAKAAILPFLERLHDELAIPMLYVSHDADEVARLADHLVLMAGGRITASGPTAELLTRLDLPLARGDHAEALVNATIAVHDADDQLTEARFSGGSLWVPLNALPVGQPVRLRILARDVSLTLTPQTGTSILNHFPVTITELAKQSPSQLLARLDADGTPLLARLTRRSARLLALAPGSRVHAQVKSVALLA